ncbi:MAG TPA: DNA helicase RecG [Chloroflexi bacterium]|nr:DNA helicase RecG [Chloroflexota bacterium]
MPEPTLEPPSVEATPGPAPSTGDDLLLEETAPVTYEPSQPPAPAVRSGDRRQPDLSPEEALRRDRELDASITTLTGISDTYARRLARLGVATVRDLLYHLPARYEDFSALRRISELMYGQEVTIVGVVEETKNRQSKRGSVVTTTVISDGTGTVQATWFSQPWLSGTLTPGKLIRLSGKVSEYLGRVAFQSPRWEPVTEEQLHTAGIIPIYPLTDKVGESWLRARIRAALKQFAHRTPDPLPLALRESFGVFDLPAALELVHAPEILAQIEEARRRLAFDELLLLQLGVLAQRREWRSQPGRALQADAAVLERFYACLPFRLTGAQARALDEILGDVADPAPMSRLLQGDVGSGKTVVAAAAMLIAVAAGTQVAFMAPTEILAEQHYKSLTALLSQPAEENARADGQPLLGTRDPAIALLIGSTPAAERRDLLGRLAAGEVDIIVGTHALIQPDVTFKELGLVVVDEQHRFGVEQRGALRQKGGAASPDVLVMSATPIPRSLALALYGDLDLSVIEELPPGRTPVVTRIITPRQRERAYTYIRAQVREGRQAFIICPLVEESEKSEARAAVDEYHRLQQEVFPDLKLGLLHGRMTGAEKEAVMAEFYRGERHILVSTAVVEVGIDVPNATVMLVEGANRFGLAQLHQFRGRVGRGAHRSVCLLLAEADLSAESEQRLRVLEETTDGFKLAEIDLQLRGPGEFFGTRQSGIPDLTVARLGDSRAIDLARRAAQALITADPGLDWPEHQLLKRRVNAFWARLRGDLS